MDHGQASARLCEQGAHLQEYLSLVVPHLSSDLVSDRARENLYALGRLLPVTDLAGFEINLAKDDGRADLITRHPKGRDKISPVLMAHPVWICVARCLQQLRNRSGPLAPFVKVIDLEFDLPGAPPPLPLPGIFLELKRDIELSTECVGMLAEQILGEVPPDWMKASLRQSLDALPRGARVIHLGALRSRDVQQLRVVVGRIPPSRVTAYLEAAGWGGDCRAIEVAIDTFSSLIDSVTLSVDVGRQLGDRIGIECFLGPTTEKARNWSTLMGRLQQAGLCTEEKARALLAWAGTCERGRCKAPWPSSLTWGDALLGSEAASIFVRFLSHVKLVFSHGVPLSAKMYVGFAHYWCEHRYTGMDELSSRTLGTA